MLLQAAVRPQQRRLKRLQAARRPGWPDCSCSLLLEHRTLKVAHCGVAVRRRVVLLDRARPDRVQRVGAGANGLNVPLRLHAHSGVLLHGSHTLDMLQEGDEQRLEQPLLLPLPTCGHSSGGSADLHATIGRHVRMCGGGAMVVGGRAPMTSHRSNENCVFKNCCS